MSSFGQKCHRLFVSLIQAALLPAPTLLIWQWLDQNVVVPMIVGSREHGPLDTGRMPQWRGLLEKYADRRCHFFTLCKSARVGGTLFFGICLVLEKIARWPGPIIWMDPTRKTAIRVSRAEIEPYMLECKPVRELCIFTKTFWTVLEKQLKNCLFSVIGAGSNNDMGGRQGELFVINEQDRIPNRSTDAPPPSEEAIARTSQFEETRKIVRNSTPTLENGLTWGEFLAGSQDYCYVPCPECQRKQRLTFWKESADPERWIRLDSEPDALEREQFSDVKEAPDGRGWLCKGIPQTGRIWWPPECKGKKTKLWDVDAIARGAKYECAFCEAKISYDLLWWMNDRYEWRSHNPDAPRDHVSAQISALYSPWQSWGAIAKRYMLAIGSATKLHAFYNLILGLPYIAVPTRITKKALELLQQNSPRYARQFPDDPEAELILPARPVILDMECDVQQTELWYTMRAVMEDGSRYVIAWGTAGSFAELERLSNRVWKYDHGPDAPAEARYEEFTVFIGIIDTGYKAKRQSGVYEFLHTQGGRWQGVKGGAYSLAREKPITETTVTFNFKGLGAVDVPVVQFNDFILKEELYRFVIKERRPPPLFLPENLDEHFVTQVTSEHLTKRKMQDGRNEDVWQVTDGIDPHLGDCLKYGEVLSFIFEPPLLQKIRVKMDEQRAAIVARLQRN